MRVKKVGKKKRVISKRTIKEKIEFKKKKVISLRSLYMGRAILVAPPVFSFFEDVDGSDNKVGFDSYKDFLFFINELNELSKKNSIWIDFSRVRLVKASAILVLYANIEQIQKRENNRDVIKSSICGSKDASSLFYSFGVWKLTNEEAVKPKYRDESLPMLRTATIIRNKASRQDSDSVREVVSYVRKVIDDSNLDENEEAILACNAITESVSNVGLHAYSNKFFSPDFIDFSTSWWIVVHKLGQQLYIAVYDMGVGIPVTLKNKDRYQEIINEMISVQKMEGSIFYVDDACRIKAAVEYGNSRFNMSRGGEKHGKGLSEARELVDVNPRGNLVIYSASGTYSHSKKEGDYLNSLPFPFKGTLIQWNLYLGSDSHEQKCD